MRLDNASNRRAGCRNSMAQARFLHPAALIDQQRDTGIGNVDADGG